MGNNNNTQLSALEHLGMARAKLVALSTSIAKFERNTLTTQKQARRVRNALGLTVEAMHALSVNTDPDPDTEEQLPF